MSDELESVCRHGAGTASSADRTAALVQPGMRGTVPECCDAAGGRGFVGLGSKALETVERVYIRSAQCTKSSTNQCIAEFARILQGLDEPTAAAQGRPL